MENTEEKQVITVESQPVKKKNGGVRPGSGRKKGHKASHTLEALALKQTLIEQYREHAHEVNLALITKARVGEIPAIKELFDRVYGRAPQTGEFDLNIKEIIKLTDEQFEQALRARAKRGLSNRNGSEGVS